MKVLIFCVTNSYSGAEKYVHELALAFRRRNISVSFIIFPNSKFEEELRDSDFPIINGYFGSKLGKRTFIKYLFNFHRNRREISRILESNSDVDLIITQFKGEQLIIGSLSNRKIFSKIIAIEHGPIPSPLIKIPFIRWKLHQFYSKIGTVFAVSRVVSESLSSIGIRSKILPAVSSDNLLEIRGILPIRPTVLFAGRLTRKKGVKKYVKIAKLNPEVLFHIAGDGPLREWVHKKTKVIKNLVELGFVKNIKSELENCMAVVILSNEHGEGLPLIATEAIQSGRHVYISKDSVVAEFLKREFTQNVTVFDSRNFNYLHRHLTHLTVSNTHRISPQLANWEEISRLVLP